MQERQLPTSQGHHHPHLQPHHHLQLFVLSWLLPMRHDQLTPIQSSFGQEHMDRSNHHHRSRRPQSALRGSQSPPLPQQLCFPLIWLHGQLIFPQTISIFGQELQLLFDLFSPTCEPRYPPQFWRFQSIHFHCSEQVHRLLPPPHHHLSALSWQLRERHGRQAPPQSSSSFEQGSYHFLSSPLVCLDGLRAIRQSIGCDHCFGFELACVM